MNTTGCVYGLLNLKLRNLLFSTLVFIFLSARQIKLNLYKSSHHIPPILARNPPGSSNKSKKKTRNWKKHRDENLKIIGYMNCFC